MHAASGTGHLVFECSGRAEGKGPFVDKVGAATSWKSTWLASGCRGQQGQSSALLTVYSFCAQVNAGLCCTIGSLCLWPPPSPFAPHTNPLSWWIRPSLTSLTFIYLFVYLLSYICDLFFLSIRFPFEKSALTSEIMQTCQGLEAHRMDYVLEYLIREKYKVGEFTSCWERCSISTFFFFFFF